MFDEPQLFCRYLGIGKECPIVADQRFELAAQGIALNPVDHEATIARTSCNTVVRVDEFEVVTHIFPTLHQVIIWIASYSM